MDAQGDGQSAEEPTFVCPSCGKGGVRPAVRTSAGAYCQCGGCGYVWLSDDAPASFKSLLRRRKSDDRTS